jgi:ubiquinone/menaquinone biosynthesis C-methylase UbiE
MPESTEPKYVPALGFHCLTPCYDAIVRTTGRERTIKQALIEQARLAPGQQVLDLGCGTGTLALWIKQRQPLAAVTGVDGDPKVLAIACRKTDKANLSVRFDQALSHHLPYPAAQFDRVLSSMFFHHLAWPDKVRTAQEIFRVLKPGAGLHIADWGRAANLCMRGLFLTVQLLDGVKNTQGHAQGKLLSLFEQNGFVDVAQRQTFSTLYGTAALYSATKPG